MALIPLGFWAASGGAAVTYWLSKIEGAGYDQGNSVATDSGGNTYQLGYTGSIGSGSNDLFIAKHDPAGAVQWQRVLGDTGNDNGNFVTVDSSDNVYVIGSVSPPGFGFRFFVAKYNSSGAIQWQKLLEADQGWGITVDASGNLYCAGYTTLEGLGSRELLIAKYDSSGAIQWRKLLGDTLSNRAYAIAIDSASNLYVCGEHDSSTPTGDDALIAKYNSDGVIQWQRVLGGTGGDTARAISIDSSGNAYVLGYTSSTGAGNNDFLLAKYNSAGTIQWQRVLGGTEQDFGKSVAIDSSDNVYVTGNSLSAGAGSYDFLIVKYNSAGTIQWQRTLGTTGSDAGNSIAIDSGDNLYIFGTPDFLLAKLPNDGSLTGTYTLNGVDFVYAASSLTGATSTLTASTSSLTAATSSAASSTATLTDASSSLTSYFVEIGA
tara:strand:- start:335 stop:1633 length:1299 start_codon:yes stop_codon:yes gene_type:complete